MTTVLRRAGDLYGLPCETYANSFDGVETGREVGEREHESGRYRVMAGNGLKFTVNETVFFPRPLSHAIVSSGSTYNSFPEKRKGRRVDGMERDEKRERKMAIHDWIDERGSKVMNVHLFVLSPAEKQRTSRHHLLAVPRAIEWCRLIYWTRSATVDADDGFMLRAQDLGSLSSLQCYPTFFLHYPMLSCFFCLFLSVER